MTVSERLESVTQQILETWHRTNGCLGVRRAKLLSFGHPEKPYLIRRALAKLRKEKRIRLDHRYYCINQMHFDALKLAAPVQEVNA